MSARYLLTHWGERGPVDSRVLGAPDLRAGELVELGQLVEISYRTIKGGDGGRATIYDHTFKTPLPFLVYNATGLFICGGGYRIGMRGIIG